MGEGDPSMRKNYEAADITGSGNKPFCDGMHKAMGFEG